MQHLHDKWREIAAKPDTHELIRVTLLECARQSEEESRRRWHDAAHDGMWYPDECALCRKEMEDE